MYIDVKKHPIAAQAIEVRELFTHKRINLVAWADDTLLCLGIYRIDKDGNFEFDKNGEIFIDTKFCLFYFNPLR